MSDVANKKAAGGMGTMVGGVRLNRITPENSSDATVVTCDPNNWGMRHSNMVPNQYGRNYKTEYPVAQAYVTNIKPALQRVDWTKLRWPFDKKQKTYLKSIFSPSIEQAWSATAYRLPTIAYPDIKFSDEVNLTDFGVTSSGAGFFSGNKWVVVLQEQDFKPLLTPQKTDFDRALRELASTLFHEGRHAQQYFWAFNSMIVFPSDYGDFELMRQLLFPDLQREQEKVYDAIQSATRPDDPIANISIKRMTVGFYFISLYRHQNYGFNNHTVGSIHDPNSEISKVYAQLQELSRKYTKIPLETIWDPQSASAYRFRPHEEDSFAMEDILKHYWNGAVGDLPAPGKCTDAYQYFAQ